MVDADHAHCEVTGRSVTGILVFIKSTPVRWYSKMQKTVETSTYGSELVATRIASDIALEFRYNLRMMGFDLDGPANIFGDNQAAILNTTIPSSQLKRKIHGCAYYRLREMIACRAIRFMHCPSIYNATDVLTKPLGGIVHRRLVEPILCGEGIPIVFQASKSSTTPTTTKVKVEGNPKNTWRSGEKVIVLLLEENGEMKRR
jgi:hypothetical protein